MFMSIRNAGRISAEEILTAIEAEVLGMRGDDNDAVSSERRLERLLDAMREQRRCHEQRGQIIKRITDVCGCVAAGDFEARLLHIYDLPPAERAACDAVNDLIDRTDAFIREATASLEAISQCRYDRLLIETGMRGLYKEAARNINAATRVVADRVSRFGDVVGRFRNDVSSALAAIEAAGGRLEQASSGMTETAGEVRSRAGNVSGAFARQVAMVAAVAGTTRELSSSIGVLDESVRKAAAMAGEAVQETSGTEEDISRLSEASDKIGDVLNLIRDIAEQTNLLALNATIEAARAGEAGKGFAVVAGEVKNLAGQTARATEDIARQISAMQQVTSAVVAAMERIGDHVRRVDEIAMTMAAAVSQQKDATNEIAASAERASEEMEGAEQDIAAVSAIAGQSADMALTVHDATGDVCRETGNIRDLVAEFLDEAGRVA